MKIIATKFKSEVIVFEKDFFGDDRGFFYEAFNAKWSEKINRNFVQDNISYSKFGTLRGMHYQKEPFAQAKFVQVLKGEVFDVVVDVRKDSKTFLQWHIEVLSEKNKRAMYIPEGFAHGFLVTSDEALFFYKCTNFYSKQNSMIIAWNDPEINIIWPFKPTILSDNDKNGLSASQLKDAN